MMQLQSTLDNAQSAFKEWREFSFNERQKLLKELSKILLLNKNKFAGIITREMNKPITQSVAEIEKCAGMTDFYAACENILDSQPVPKVSERAEIRHEPLGVILGVMPWNYPFWQVLRFAVPTILAGNTVLLKHASICHDSGNALEKVILDAGFPAGIFQHEKISHDEVEWLLENPIIQGVSLTGSEAAGRKIAESAGKNLKKCVLELGGNDAFIVLDDANLAMAAKDAAQARLQNCGQTCVAGKRFIIEKNIFDEFLPKFIEEYQKYLPAEPMNPKTILSGMAREDLATELLKQYETAVENGASIIIPLQRLSELEFQPGLLLMNENNPIADQELFGPLGMVFKAENADDALRIANSTSFGLANAVYSSSEDRIRFFTHNLASGSVAVNQVFRSDWRMPFGGRKNSGYGTELSLLSLREFTAPKSIMRK